MAAVGCARAVLVVGVKSRASVTPLPQRPRDRIELALKPLRVTKSATLQYVGEPRRVHLETAEGGFTGSGPSLRAFGSCFDIGRSHSRVERNDPGTEGRTQQRYVKFRGAARVSVVSTSDRPRVANGRL